MNLKDTLRDKLKVITDLPSDLIDQVKAQVESRVQFEKLSEEQLNQIISDLKKLHPDEVDPWGLDLRKARIIIKTLYPLYKNYFKVRTFGTQNVKDKPYMVVSNHSGQIAIDGMLLTMAFSVDIAPPRILRAMVERFFTGIPFVGNWAAEGGAVLGDRQNCLNLLKKGQSILVFPEGVRGVAKSTPDYYQLQGFTRGFFRMALQEKVPILPIAVIGAEEFYPYVYQAKGLAKKLGLPALPLSPNLIPLPSPVDIYIGEEYEIPKDLSHDATDVEIDKHVFAIQKIIQKMTEEGLRKRRSFWANSTGPKGSSNE